jgi:adenylate cyclase
MRRLAAIMFTDLVGYSALTQENEALALELLEEHRKILRPVFEKHGGREVETAGDSFFVEFNSAVEAASCAIDIQTILHERNELESPDRKIRLRIGLHIGDVVYVGRHVHGDAVNIAARMEPLSQPGGICVSQDVARQIRNKVSYPVLQMDKEKLKNISLPMDVYCIQLPWLAPPEKNREHSSPGKKIILYGLLSLLPLAMIVFFYFNGKDKVVVEEETFARSRLAVLPLDNISPNEGDAYFADGMTEELISSLSKIGGLKVIAKTSVMKYRDMQESLTIPQIASELMVGSILEGSVRKFENQARIHVSLVEVRTQAPIWTMEYDRELQDIFSIQSEIARNVARELEIRLVGSENEQLNKKYTDNPAAYDEYLLGKSFLNKRTSEGIQQAVIHFENAVGHDSNFVLPLANLAYAYTLMGAAGYGNISKDIARNRAAMYISKALEKDSSLPEVHAASGYIKFRTDWDWSGAERAFRQALLLNPNYVDAHEWYALFLAIHKRLDEALVEINAALELDPLSPSANNGLARIYHFRGEYAKAIEQFQMVLERNPGYAESYFGMGMSYFAMAEYDQAIDPLQKAAELSGRRPIVLGILGCTYARLGRMEEARTLLTELESGPMNNDKRYAMTFIKGNIGQFDEALKILDELQDEKYGVLIYMKIETKFFDTTNPGYQELLRKMNFN